MSGEIIFFKSSKSVPFDYSHVTFQAPKPQLLKPQASVLRCYILSKASSASHFSHSWQNCSTLDLRDWAAKTRLLNSNSWFFNVSHSSWICCNCNATACLLDSFKRSRSLSSCIFLRCSHSSFSSCNCNATACLSFNLWHSLSSCPFLKFSHSDWSCCICNVSACLLESSSFNRSHSCVNCCTWMWSSSCFVFTFAWEVFFSDTNNKLSKTTRVTLFIPTVDPNLDHLGVKKQNANWVQATSCKRTAFSFSASRSSRVIKMLARASTARSLHNRTMGPNDNDQCKHSSHWATWCQFHHISPFFAASSTWPMTCRRALRAAVKCSTVTLSRSICCIFSSLDSFKKQSRSSTLSGEEPWGFRDPKEAPQ